MTKAERLLFIVNLFRVKKSVSMKELVGECGVSRRTIYRDILSLSGLNIPVYFDDGYRLSREISLPALNFTRDEQELIGYCLKNSHLSRSPRFKDMIRNIELKILSALPDIGKARLSTLLVSPDTQSDYFSVEQDAIITSFLQALMNKDKVEVSLKSGNRKWEELSPVSLQIKGKKWRLNMKDKKKLRTVSVPIERIDSFKISPSKNKLTSETSGLRKRERSNF